MMKVLVYTDKVGKTIYDRGGRFWAWKRGNTETGDLPFLINPEHLDEANFVTSLESIEFIHSTSEPVEGYKGKEKVVSIKELFEKFNKSRLTRD